MSSRKFLDRTMTIVGCAGRILESRIFMTTKNPLRMKRGSENLAASLGLEPRYWDPESHVLPLDDKAIYLRNYSLSPCRQGFILFKSFYLSIFFITRALCFFCSRRREDRITTYVPASKSLSVGAFHPVWPLILWYPFWGLERRGIRKEARRRKSK